MNGNINFTGDLLQNGQTFDPSVWEKNGNDVFYDGGNVGVGISNPIFPIHIKKYVDDMVMGYDGAGLILETTLTENNDISTKWKINNDGMYLGFQIKMPLDDEYKDIAHLSSFGLHLKTGLTISATSKKGVFFRVNNNQIMFSDIFVLDDNQMMYSDFFYLKSDTKNVGIGTQNPQYSLETAGSINLTDNGTNTSLRYRIMGMAAITVFNTQNASEKILDINRDWSGEQEFFSDFEKVRIYGDVEIHDRLWVTDEVAVQGNNPWPDYVFEPEYSIMPISELETYIKHNKHLPGIPTAKEVKENGQKLAENQALLLEKIEELTIYVIDLKNENNKLKMRIDKLEK